jgi:hypothetical protein
MAFEDFLSSLGGMFGGGGDQSQVKMEKPEPAASTGGASSFFPTNDSGGTDWTKLLMPALLGGGSMLASKLIGGSNDKNINKMTKNLSTSANTASGAGQAMINAASQGHLTPAQQAAVDQMKKEQNTKNAQYLAGLGIPVSTAQVEMSNKTDQDALAFAQKLIDQSMQEGISLTGLGNAASTQLLTNALKQKEDLANTIGEVAKQMGAVLNQPQQKPQVGQPDVASSISSGAQQWGMGDYDPYANLMTVDQT